VGVGTRPGGRSARIRAAVQAATIAELAARGFAELSLEAVAERARVHRTTVYRRWPDKPALVRDALTTEGDEAFPVPDTGRLDEDLRGLGHAIDGYLERPYVHALLATMAAGGRGHDSLADLRAQFWADRLGRAHAIVMRAADRGEIPGRTDPAGMIDLLAGPIYLRRFIQGRPMGPAEIDALAAAVVAAHSGGRSPVHGGTGS